MKAINLGDNTYDIFDDAMKVYSELPTPVSYTHLTLPTTSRV